MLVEEAVTTYRGRMGRSVHWLYAAQNHAWLTYPYTVFVCVIVQGTCTVHVCVYVQGTCTVHVYVQGTYLLGHWESVRVYVAVQDLRVQVVHHQKAARGCQARQLCQQVLHAVLSDGRPHPLSRTGQYKARIEGKRQLIEGTRQESKGQGKNRMRNAKEPQTPCGKATQSPHSLRHELERTRLVSNAQTPRATNIMSQSLTVVPLIVKELAKTRQVQQVQPPERHKHHDDHFKWNPSHKYRATPEPREQQP